MQATNLSRIRWGHAFEGGTGITNLGASYAAEKTPLYMQAAINCGHDGITVINRTMDGGEGWSLHDTAKRGDLSAFWDEVRRLEAAA